MPQIILNWPAILVSVVAGMIFGFLWYGPVFGRTWGIAMGMKMDKAPEAQEMRKGLLLQAVGLFLVTYVLAHTGEVWRPSVWGVGEDQANYMYGIMNGFYIWLGFYIPMQLSKVAWEMRSWKVFLINTGHDFIKLQIIAQILSNWR